MKLLTIALSAILTFFTGCSRTEMRKPAAANDQIPMKDFFKDLETNGGRISLNGKYISFLKPWNGRLNIFVQPLSADRLPEGEMRRVTSSESRSINGYFWKDDETILYVRDNAGDENFHIYTLDVSTGKEKDVTPFDKTRASILNILSEVSDTDVLIQTNQRNPEVFDVYRLNTKTGDIKMVAQNPGAVEGWVTDHKGEVRVAVESDGLNTKIYTRKSEKDEFKEVLKFDFKSSFDPLFFTPDNKFLYAASNLGRDKQALVKADPESGKELQLLFRHPEVDVNVLSYSKKRKAITAAFFETAKQEVHFFDKVAKKRYERIKSQLPGLDAELIATTRDEDLFIVNAKSDTVAGRYYLYDEKKDRLTFLADRAPWLDPAKLAKMKPVKYKSRDGLTIHGYLTLPKTSVAKHLPVVINPHGGPWARDSWGYNDEVQFLASRGYAVLQMNFRGSTGYGREFWAKSFKQWGKTMQDDITDGVNWLTSQGIADSRRICIYGTSYGGYATLAGLAFTPDVYACGIDMVGVANIFTILATIPPYWKSGLQKMYAMMGNPETEKELLTAISPVFHADKIKAPLFVAQGRNDPRVNVQEADQIVNSLRARGVEVKYMLKENEGHGFMNEENRFDFYQAMEEFLHEHIGTARGK